MLNKQLFLIFTFATFLTLTCIVSAEEISGASNPAASQPSTGSPASHPIVFHARVSATTTAVAAPGEMIAFQAIADCGEGNVAMSGSQSCTFTAIDGQSPIGSCPTQNGTTPSACDTEAGALTRYWLGSCIAGPVPATLTVFATCMPAAAMMTPMPMPIAPMPISVNPIPATAPRPAAVPIPATAPVIAPASVTQNASTAPATQPSPATH